MSQRERRALKRRWRKPRRRAVPSPSAVFRYLEAFHDEEQEGRREPGKAFIPLPGEPLLGLRRINCEVAAFVQSHSPQGVATLDIDATLVETHKSDAFYCYKRFKAYQPLNVYWAEQELVVHSEFRDGNVPAGYEQLRVFQEALASMPPGVGKVYHRSDTAGCQQDLLKYCAQGRNKRFGVIEFAIGADVTPAFSRVRKLGFIPMPLSLDGPFGRDLRPELHRIGLCSPLYWGIWGQNAFKRRSSALQVTMRAPSFVF